jgi:heavy metal sensor kinase
MTQIPLREYQLSLRARATSWYVGLLAVALAVSGVGVYVGVQTYLKVSLQRGLKGTAQTIASDFLTKLPAKGQSWVIGEVRESYEASPNDHYVRLSVGNSVLYQTADMRDPAIPVAGIALPAASTEGAFHRQTVQGHVVMVYALPFHTGDGRLVEVEAGTSLYAMDQTLRSLTKILVITTVPILLLAACGGYLLMKRPLRPLVVLTDKAANIGRTKLGERLPVIPTGDELEQLTHSLNGMIDRLEEALNHNHRFSADASHELRTPLTIMRGELEEMLRLEDLPTEAVENVVSTLEEIDRMSRIVNSLMVITRLDAGGERMDMKVLDLSALVRTTMEHLRLLAEEKGLPLTWSCPEGIPVYADPMRMKQVLVNLVDNAIKYTVSNEAGNDRSLGAVEVSVFESGTTATLKVVDHGIGIAPETLPHVFERFYRADFARSRGAGGVGLGLAIVKAIVVAHDGAVSISSTPGQGSTVLVQLPLAKPAAPAVLDEPAAARRQRRHQTA